jgi:hypothetical protein
VWKWIARRPDGFLAPAARSFVSAAGRILKLSVLVSPQERGNFKMLLRRL